jgi:hypothetical protein
MRSQDRITAAPQHHGSGQQEWQEHKERVVEVGRHEECSWAKACHPSNSDACRDD